MTPLPDRWKFISQRWQELPKPLKIGIMTAFVVSGAAIVLWTSMAANRTTLLFNGYRFTELEMQRIELALSAANLRDFTWDSGKLRIPTRTWDSYLKAIAEADVVPKGLGEHEANLAKSFNPFLTSDRLKDQKLTARTRDIAAALQSLPYVEYAYIMYDEKQQGFAGLGQKSAVVWIKPAIQPNLTANQVHSIAKQVQASFAGLAFEDVTVVDVGTGMTHRPAEMEASPLHEKLYAIKTREETNLQSKLERALSKFGNVRVEVQLDFDPVTRKEITKTDYELEEPDNESSLSETSNKENSPRRGSGQAEIVKPRAKSTLRVTTSDRTELHENVRGFEVTKLEQGMLRIHAASAIIAIPYSFLERRLVGDQVREEETGAARVRSSMDLPNSQEWIALRSEVQGEVESIAKNLMPQTTSQACSILVTDFDDRLAISPPMWTERLRTFFFESDVVLSIFFACAVSILAIRFLLRTIRKRKHVEPSTAIDISSSPQPAILRAAVDQEIEARVNELLQLGSAESADKIKEWLRAA